MKKLLIIIAMLGVGFAMNLMATTDVQAQSKKKLLKTENAKFTIQVDNFMLIFEDTQGQMDVHETMKKINPSHNPKLNVIKDEKAGIWRIATTLEEANMMPDKMKVVAAEYDKILPYKRTGYIN
jgi:hypothetical protein